MIIEELGLKKEREKETITDALGGIMYTSSYDLAIIQLLIDKGVVTWDEFGQSSDGHG